ARAGSAMNATRMDRACPKSKFSYALFASARTVDVWAVTDAGSIRQQSSNARELDLRLPFRKLIEVVRQPVGGIRLDIKRGLKRAELRVSKRQACFARREDQRSVHRRYRVANDAIDE